MTTYPPTLPQITSPKTHAAALAHSSGLSPTGPIVLIYVTSSANPICRRTTPKIQLLAANSKYADGERVKFYQMELTPETAPMIKFGIQNTPIFIAYRGKWCQTVLGPDLVGVERMLDGQLGLRGK
ncbi:uncharacterized protein AB675_2447 [Cyphellophora attinorum]|uniref:Thioredoxin domain-containing protein n=1 Tax=Cyphellophora attinorum TaxID=1664694 RepID=A0A0N0NRN7_9EURO|nr:uncharacterized protein AB675_2447 [Phialophora attinorum]KPI45301.1 hypothetical protein AB675_2447 [Phialophora attinorum]